MTMLKKISFILLLMILTAVSACALADNPVDPRYSQMQAFKREELQYVRRMEQAKKDGKEIYYASGGVSIKISGTKSPTQTLTFKANLENAGDLSQYEFRWGITDQGRDSGGYLYYPQYDDNAMLGKTSITYKFYSAGSYRVYLSVYEKNNDSYKYIGSDYQYFDIADDGTHPTIEQKAQQIYQSCKASTQWKTALNLYDWLTHHAYYDSTYEHHGADILFLGYGVCDSYSKAYMMLLQAAGIPVERTFGEDHAWNALQLGGKWYQADATWDDPGSSKPGEGKLVSGGEGHEFFCVNAAAMKEISSHHYADGSQGGTHAAECTSMDANYFIHEGLWKSFGDHQWGEYNYDTQQWQESVNPYITQIVESISGGNPSCEKSISTWVYYYDKDGSMQSESIRNPILREIMKAGLPGYTFKIDGDKVKMQTTISDSLVITAKLKGWDITEKGTLKLPKKTETVQAQAFYGDQTATTLTIQQGCKTIGSKAFGSTAIRTVKIPLSVTTIADDAFYGCTKKIIFITKNETAIEYAKAHGIMVANP